MVVIVVVVAVVIDRLAAGRNGSMHFAHEIAAETHRIGISRCTMCAFGMGQVHILPDQI